MGDRFVICDSGGPFGQHEVGPAQLRVQVQGERRPVLDVAHLVRTGRRAGWNQTRR